METKLLNLLIVDAEPVDRLAVQRALRSAGVATRFVECGDADSALARLAGERFDCVFLDLRLPDADGLAVVRVLRARGDNTPVIALTGYGDEKLVAQLLEAGAADHYGKAGLDPERLAQSLRRAVRLREAEEAAASVRRSLRHHAEQLAGLAQLSLRIHADRSPDSIAELVTTGARELLSCAGAGLATARLHLLAGEAVQSLPVPEALPAGRGAVPAGERDALERALPPGGSPQREWISATVPGSGDGAPGLLYAWDKRDGGAFSDGDLAVLRQLAQLASVALDNAGLVEQLRRASRARDDLIAIVSHDLRSPLNVVTMAASFLHELVVSPNFSPEQARNTIERVRRAARHMSALVNDLLDASRIEAGALQLDVKPTLSRELLDEVVETYRPLAAGKGVQLVGSSVLEGVAVQADRSRLFQVFSNLVGNAIKFTPEGGLISLDATSGDGVVTFAVRDSGPGIPSQHVPLLFDRYWQPRTGASREGAGLGLFIAKGIVEAHRGHISVKSAPGQGAVFAFTVPLAG